MKSLRWNKYRSKRTELDGRSFSSKLEASVYCTLKASGVIIEKCQDHIYLTDARIAYIVDFKCSDKNEVFWVEAKGFETPEWRIKRRLWLHYGPGKLVIYKGTDNRHSIHEVLDPKRIPNDF